LPGLVDRSVPEDLAARIGAILDDAGIGPDGIAGSRTRRAGSFPQIELTLTTAGCRQVREFLRRAGGLDDRLRTEVPDADISIAVSVGDAADGDPK
jgi:hypothetical protein